LVEILNRAAERLREADLPSELVLEMERLTRQVDEPCVVAVVGRVNAGKSTFINALLRDDLAVVGTLETTATINYFSYVDPKDYDPERPVRCYWRGGGFSDESRMFLDSLQGNDLETLRRADGIQKLEYRLPDSLLKEITLVDTPGTGGVVEEHQDRTADFMNLSEQLRTRHEQDTQRLNSEADAVIYLIGSEAKATDKAFLQEFAEATGGQSRSFNALGVMAMIDLMEPEDMARCGERAERIAEQLNDSLNTVVPVSASLYREVDRLEDDKIGLNRLVGALRRIPFETLGFLLDDEDFFLNEELSDCPVSSAERRELRGDAPWRVFATIARVAADNSLSPDLVVKKLRELSGFDMLLKVLNLHFIERGHLLRYYRIVNDARKVSNEIRFTHLPERRRRARQDRARLDRFLAFIRGSGGDPDTSSELQDFVCRHLGVDEQANALERLWQELDGELAELYHRLIEDNADFEALQRLDDCASEFSASELDELRVLLGLQGGAVDNRLPPGRADDIEYVGRRQLDWQQRKLEAFHGSCRYILADRAYTRYGLILAAMLDQQERGSGFEY
jgi:predicted GTPase